MIRGLETTFGKNGWHIHTHELWFVDAGASHLDVLFQTSTRWTNYLSKKHPDIESIQRFGVDIKDNADCSDYLAKSGKSWGVDREISMSNSKRNDGLIKSKKGVTPFQLAEEGRKKEFLEYIGAFKGRAVVFWSRGLREKLAPDADESEDINEEFHVILEKSEWDSIRRKGLRGELLQLINDSSGDEREFQVALFLNNALKRGTKNVC